MPIQQMLLGAGGPAPEVVGQALLTGEHRSGSSWTVPDNVTSISVVLIGPGAAATAGASGNSGAGGALAFVNNLTVTPGATLTYITAIPDETDTSGLKSELSGPASGSQAAWTITANGGQDKTRGTATKSASIASMTGYKGGYGYDTTQLTYGRFYPGGGAAGSYAANGASGGYGNACSGWNCTPFTSDAQDGSSSGGGGGGGGRGKDNQMARGGGGGGIAPYGAGTNGSGGLDNNDYGGNIYTNRNGAAGQGGSYVSGLSGGTPTNNTDDSDLTGANAGDFGGGAGAFHNDNPPTQPAPIPGEGCIRIIWPGSSRQFPSTRTADE